MWSEKPEPSRTIPCGIGERGSTGHHHPGIAVRTPKLSGRLLREQNESPGGFEAQIQNSALRPSKAPFSNSKPSFRMLRQRKLTSTLASYLYDLARQFNPKLNWIALAVLNLWGVWSSDPSKLSTSGAWLNTKCDRIRFVHQPCLPAKYPLAPEWAYG